MTAFTLDDIIDEPVVALDQPAEPAPEALTSNDLNLATQVVELVQASFDFYRDKDSGGDTPIFYATRKGSTARQVQVDVNGSKFANLVRVRVMEDLKKVVSGTTITEAVRYVHAMLSEAVIPSTPVLVPQRATVRRINGAITEVVLDVGNPDDRQVIVVTANGHWLQPSYDGILFATSRSVRPLTLPSETPSYSALWEALSFDADATEAALIRGWLANVFISDAERPLLLFAGEQGSGKTTRAAAVMECVNPLKIQNGAPVIGGGLGKVTDGEVKALNSYLVGYDNLGKVTVEQSNHIARLVTGDAVERRALYTDGDTFEVAYKRTGVMTAISVPNFLPDAMERLVILNLTPFADGARKLRTDLWEHYVAQIPDVFAAVLADLSTIIRNQHVPVEKVPRMADYYANLARLDRACADAYLQSFDSTVEEQAENDPFVQAVLKAVKGADGVLSRSTLEELRVAVERSVEPDKREYLPHTATSFGKKLRETATLLRIVGIEYEDGKKKKVRGVRTYSLTLVGEPTPVAGDAGDWREWGTPLPPASV